MDRATKSKINIIRANEDLKTEEKQKMIAFVIRLRDRIVKDLSINEISTPIEMGNSLLFIKINDKRQINLKVDNLENLKKKISDTKKNQMFNLYSNSHLSKLKNQSKIEYK